MNEPHDLSVSTWVTSVQTAVNAIRAAGATSQYILIPGLFKLNATVYRIHLGKGSSWSSAQALPTEAGPALAQVIDPAGGNNKLVFDGGYKEFYLSLSEQGRLMTRLVHKYLDSDNSGTHADCTTVSTLDLQIFRNSFADYHPLVQCRCPYYSCRMAQSQWQSSGSSQ